MDRRFNDFADPTVHDSAPMFECVSAYVAPLPRCALNIIEETAFRCYEPNPRDAVKRNKRVRAAFVCNVQLEAAHRRASALEVTAAADRPRGVGEPRLWCGKARLAETVDGRVGRYARLPRRRRQSHGNGRSYRVPGVRWLQPVSSCSDVRCLQLAHTSADAGSRFGPHVQAKLNAPSRGTRPPQAAGSSTLA